ncbi:MAG: hypothetical protein K0R90_639 [Oscillospiraceae bacterium]|jgi:hypothetical protein|nr:hypothetical protein [Oscillospiraceae bacterium]
MSKPKIKFVDNEELRNETGECTNHIRWMR